MQDEKTTIEKLIADVEYLKKRVRELETEKANLRAVQNIPGYDGGAKGQLTYSDIFIFGGGGGGK